MSDRRGVCLALLLLALGAAPAEAQELAEWQQRLAEANSRMVAATDAMKAGSVKRVYDRMVREGEASVSFVAGDLSARDSVAIARGLANANETLRARFGESGVALTTGARWNVDSYSGSSRRRVLDMVSFQRVGESQTGQTMRKPIDPAVVEGMVIARAGERLVSRTRALNHHNGWAVLQPDDRLYAEVGRRLSTSWAGAARRCAAGAIGACMSVLAPFDPGAEPTRYFDASDFRYVVASARLPALSDSSYFAARRQCIDGADSVCADIVGRVPMIDPLNASVRGTLLAHAIELGGRDALDRAAAHADAPAMEALARIAGVSADSLVASWHARVYAALDEERATTDPSLLLSSVAWGGLLLLVATRRRFL